MRLVGSYGGSIFSKTLVILAAGVMRRTWPWLELVGRILQNSFPRLGVSLAIGTQIETCTPAAGFPDAMCVNPEVRTRITGAIDETVI